MQTGPDPQRPRNDHSIKVHFQANNGSPTFWSPALYPLPGIDPGKMIDPLLTARIEQLDSLTGFRVLSSCSLCFAQIARWTGKAKVVRVIAAGWIDVLYVKRLSDYCLLSLAVFTAIICALVNQPHDCCPGQTSHVSVSSVCGSIVWPRRDSSAAAPALRSINR